MHTRYVTACLMGAVSLMLLIGPACSKKEIQATSGSKSSERPMAKADRPDSGTAARPEPGISEQDPLKPGKGPSAENLPGESTVPKAQPCDPTSRIAEDIRRALGATAASGL